MGLSIVETSHRSAAYEAVHNEVVSDLRELMTIPPEYHVLLLAGGATLQFSMVPMNFLDNGSICDLVVSGAWARKAMSDAKKIGKVNVLFDGAEVNYATLPDVHQIAPSTGSRYVHITTNETIGGLQWKEFPDTGTVPLIADMSSDILSRPIDVARFGLIYAGAQKNIGPAGLTVVIIREDVLEMAKPDLPAYLSYRTHAEANSLYNTPPVFSVYATGLVLKWTKEQGGMAAVAERNRMKAAVVYETIDSSNGFYSSPVDKRYRSDMNVVFRLPTEELEKEFLKNAADARMLGLAGHRSVGGCRASLYNAMPIEGAQQLSTLMREFAAGHR
jgi:phosphoserine aminotransferase